MAFSRHVVRMGLMKAAANMILGDRIVTGLVAAGTTQANGLQLSDAYDVHVFGTVAASTGAMVPYMEPGDEVVVLNKGANALLIYPYAAAESINALSAAAGLSVAVGKSASVRKIDALTYLAIVSA